MVTYNKDFYQRLIYTLIRVYMCSVSYERYMYIRRTPGEGADTTGVVLLIQDTYRDF